MLVRDAVRPWVAKLLGHGAGLTLDTHVRVIDELDDAPGSRLSSDLPGALSFDHGRRRASDCGRVIQMSSMRSSGAEGGGLKAVVAPTPTAVLQYLLWTT